MDSKSWKAYLHGKIILCWGPVDSLLAPAGQLHGSPVKVQVPTLFFSTRIRQSKWEFRIDQLLISLIPSPYLSLPTSWQLQVEMVQSESIASRNSNTFILSYCQWLISCFMYDIQHCFICRPSDSTVSEDAGIEPRTVATLALTARSSNHSARSHPHFNFNIWDTVDRGFIHFEHSSISKCFQRSTKIKQAMYVGVLCDDIFKNILLLLEGVQEQVYSHNDLLGLPGVCKSK